MHISRLISEILRGNWAILPEEALAQQFFVNQLLEKENPGLGSPRASFPLKFSIGDEDGGATGSFDKAPEGSVAIISMVGTMLKYGTWCSYGTTEIVDKMWQADGHHNIIGTVLITDSPGGAVNSIPVFQDFHAKRKKSVVVLGDTVASAAYFAAVGADHIMADNTLVSGFGSIGVVANFLDLKGYYEKLGATVHTIYAPESTHKNLPFENALKGDYKLLQDEVLSPIAKKFQDYVKSQRPNLVLETEGILNGKMFFAEDALSSGLIDSIGDLSDAIKKVQDLATIQELMSN